MPDLSLFDNILSNLQPNFTWQNNTSEDHHTRFSQRPHLYYCAKPVRHLLLIPVFYIQPFAEIVVHLSPYSKQAL